MDISVKVILLVHSNMIHKNGKEINAQKPPQQQQNTENNIQNSLHKFSETMHKMY